MEKPQLNELMEWLRNNDRNRFEIYDLDKGTALHTCASYKDLTPGGTNPDVYFSKLVENGVKTVQLQKKRKNGSSYVREGCGLNFALTTEGNNSVAASGRMDSPAATQQQTLPSPFPGLMGGAGYGGLGMPEIMAMRSQADRFEDLKVVYAKLQKDYEDLQRSLERKNEDIRKLETECLTNKLGSENKPSALDKLIEGLAANPSAIPSIIASFKGPAGMAPGLNAAPGVSLSDIKSQVIDTISQAQVTDELVEAAYHIIIEAFKGNQEFLNQYNKLLINHQLISNGSDSDNNSEV